MNYVSEEVKTNMPRAREMREIDSSIGFNTSTNQLLIDIMQDMNRYAKGSDSYFAIRYSNNNIYNKKLKFYFRHFWNFPYFGERCQFLNEDRPDPGQCAHKYCCKIGECYTSRIFYATKVIETMQINSYYHFGPFEIIEYEATSVLTADVLHHMRYMTDDEYDRQFDRYIIQGSATNIKSGPHPECMQLIREEVAKYPIHNAVEAALNPTSVFAPGETDPVKIANPHNREYNRLKHFKFGQDLGPFLPGGFDFYHLPH